MSESPEKGERFWRIAFWVFIAMVLGELALLNYGPSIWPAFSDVQIFDPKGELMIVGK